MAVLANFFKNDPIEKLDSFQHNGKVLVTKLK